MKLSKSYLHTNLSFTIIFTSFGLIQILLQAFGINQIFMPDLILSCIFSFAFGGYLIMPANLMLMTLFFESFFTYNPALVTFLVTVSYYIITKTRLNYLTSEKLFCYIYFCCNLILIYLIKVIFLIFVQDIEVELLSLVTKILITIISFPLIFAIIEKITKLLELK